MKKILLLLFVLVTLPASATRITPDTQIRWNSLVVVNAAESAGLRNLLGNAGVVYNRILLNLLQRDTFSLNEAYDVCVDEFNDYVRHELGYDISSDDYDKVRTDFWSKCHEDFRLALINENNKMNKTRIYTNDKLYYAKQTDTVYAIDDNGLECKYAVFESNTDKIVATCFSMGLKDGSQEVLHYIFTSNTPDGSDTDDFLLVCGIEAGNVRYGVCDRLVYKPGEYKELYGDKK